MGWGLKAQEQGVLRRQSWQDVVDRETGRHPGCLPASGLEAGRGDRHGQWHRMRQGRARVWDALEEGFLEEVILSGAWQVGALDGWGLSGGLRVRRPQAEFWQLCHLGQATQRG